MSERVEGILSRKVGDGSERINARFLTMASGKGGVGKSFLALNLGLKLAQLNQKVLVLDLDFGLANIPLMANLSPAFTLEDVLKGECGLAQAVTTYSNLDILSGGFDIQEIESFSAEKANQLYHFLSGMEKSYDFILVDNQTGISPFALWFLLRSEKIMLILVPQPTSIANGYALLKFILSQDSTKEVAVLWNMVGSAKEAYQLKEKFDLLCTTFLDRRIKDAGWVSKEDEVEKSINKQIPLIIRYPFSQVASCLERIGLRIIDGERLGAKSDFKQKQQNEVEVK